MRTPGSRPAVGRRQIVADKSSKRGITSAHQRSRPSFSSLSIPPSPLRSIVPPFRLASFASVSFSPFSPWFFVSSLFHQMRHLRGASSPLLSSLLERRESRTMIYGLEPLSISSLYAKVEEESPGPSLRRPTWPIFRAGFARVYIRRKRTTGARLASSFLPSFARSSVCLPACLPACS